MSKFTPGPWRVQRHWSNGCEVCPDVFAGNEWVATAVGAPHVLLSEKAIHNATLMAAAPDMLDVLKDALVAVERAGHDAATQAETLRQFALADRIKAAIARAEGGAA